MKIRGLLTQIKIHMKRKYWEGKWTVQNKNQRDRSDTRVGGNAGQLLTFKYIA
jgi:hypothetical protein